MVVSEPLANAESYGHISGQIVGRIVDRNAYV